MKAVLLAIAVISFAGCWNPTSPDAVAGTPFNLKVGDTATLDDGLRIRFDSVRSDSRCPLDALCIRAGEAIIALSLAASTGNLETREMRTDATGSLIAYGNHTIQLTALAPFPRASQPIDPRDYIATFVIRAA